MKNVPLQIKELSIGYKTPLSSNINLGVNPNEFVTIMGENGCGKTTLIDCTLGLHKPFSGEIIYWGQTYSGSSVSEINQKVAWVLSQRENYPWHLNIRSYLKIVAESYRNWNWELCENLASLFQLDLTKKLFHLSMGENSKVRLLKALSFEPSLIILDELTANLSPSSKEALTKSLIELFADKKISILYVCHSDEEALRLSDRIYFMNEHGLQHSGGQNG